MTIEPVQKCAKPAKSKKLNYIAAIVFNGVFLLVANQVLNWGILPFLTQDYKQVLPIQNAQLITVLVINFLFIGFGPQWFVSALRIAANAIGIAVVLRFLSVFPFDFAAYHGFNWAVLARVSLYVGLAGLIIAIIVEFIQLIVPLVKGK